MERLRIAIPQEDLDDLGRRLRSTRWADDFGNATWTYGVERHWLEDMVRYWADEFDWRAQERAINRFEHYLTEIDGIPVHFLLARSSEPNATPLILTHGWPWTFWDWCAVIEPLTDPARHGGDPAQAFDVVVPSLPGFGFSTPLRTTGVDVRRVAELWVRLMRDVLGYERFGAAGGDWGASVTAELGHAYAEHLLGCLLTMAVAPGVDLARLGDLPFAHDEAWMRRRLAESRELTRSHVAVQRTEPQTLAYALVDSPVGTAAWIWQRRRDWSDCAGDLLTVYDRDFLCTTASIYWLTRTIGTSLRIYREHFGGSWTTLHDRTPVVQAPTAVAVFPKDIVFLPRAVAAATMNVHRWSVMPRGGHFAPAEQPGLVVEELRAFFDQLPAHST
jgi:pimeloyl-ACP methyl ester carboxylesterase